MPRESRRTWSSQRTHTRLEVSFHADEGFDGVVRSNRSSPLGDIVGFQTAKAFGQAGSFSLRVKKPANEDRWLRLWKDPEDTWVRIRPVVDGQTIDLMLGLVDTNQESNQRADGGAPSDTYSIVGRDFQKVFETTSIFTNPLTPDGARALSAYYQDPQLFSAVVGTPSNVVLALVELWIGNSGLNDRPWTLPQSLGGATFYDRLNTDNVQRMGRGSGEVENPHFLRSDRVVGMLWDVLQEFCNPAMNEIWCDLGPPPITSNAYNRSPRRKALEDLVPTLYMRERMFPTITQRRRWTHLRTRVLLQADIRNRQISVGGAANRYNYWNLQFSGFTQNGIGTQLLFNVGNGPTRFAPGDAPIVNVHSIRRHGVRKYEASTIYCPTQDRTDGPNFLKLGVDWLRRIHDWYAPAPMQLSGTIQTTRLMPEIRIGERIAERLLDGTEIYYYVEGVQHDWTYPGPGSTTLTLTHGEYRGEDLIAEIYKEYFSGTVEETGPIIEEGEEFLVEDDNFSVEAGVGVENAADAAIDKAISAGGLMSEGASELQRSLGSPPLADPEMVPTTNDIDANHADRLALGNGVSTLPVDVEHLLDRVIEAPTSTPFDQDALEQGRPIPHDDILEGIDLEGDDPLAGVEGGGL